MEKKVLDFCIIYDEDKDILDHQEIAYTTTIEKINGNDFKKHYIVDFNTLNEYQIKCILNNFDNFQTQLMGRDFYNYKNMNYHCSLVLHLLNFPKNVNRFSILDNLDYALKTIDDSIIISDTNRIFINQNDEHIWNSQKYTFKNFNLIYGYNATGKTRLIQSFAQYKNIPFFQLVKNLESGEFLSSSTDRLLNFRKILMHCKENNIPILLDDMFWGSFDPRNTIYVIDALYENAFDNQVVFTSEQELPKRLVLSRTHDSNIIDLNKNRS